MSRSYRVAIFKMSSNFTCCYKDNYVDVSAFMKFTKIIRRKIPLDNGKYLSCAFTRISARMWNIENKMATCLFFDI